MSWEEKTLGELIDTQKGFAFKSTWFLKEGIPVVKVKDFTMDSIDSATMDFVSPSRAEEFSRYSLIKNDVIVQTVGSWPSNPNSVVGKVVRVPENLGKALLNQNAVKLVPKETVSKDYLFYLLKDYSFASYIVGTAQGAANQASITLDSIRKYRVKLPSLSTQKIISRILRTYDDLIENNLKRIQLLEEAAQQLYKEWFVNFRFPGSETVPIDRDTGIPEDWERINLFDLAEIKTGYSFKAKDFNEDKKGKPAIRIRDIPNQWTRTYTTEEVSKDYIVNQGDILIGMDGFFYLDIWGGQESYLVQRVCRIRAKEEKLQGFLLEALRAPINYYEKTISGATVAHLGIKHLKEIFINIPSAPRLLQELVVFDRFNMQKLNLLNQNQKLKEARDLLLPRLMNRSIEV